MDGKIEALRNSYFNILQKLIANLQELQQSILTKFAFCIALYKSILYLTIATNFTNLQQFLQLLSSFLQKCFAFSAKMGGLAPWGPIDRKNEMKKGVNKMAHPMANKPVQFRIGTRESLKNCNKILHEVEIYIDGETGSLYIVPKEDSLEDNPFLKDLENSFKNLI